MNKFDPMTTWPARLCVESVATLIEPAAVLDALRTQNDPVLLESSANDHESWGRYSIIAANPIGRLEWNDNSLTDQTGRVLAESHQTLWPCLTQAFSCVSLPKSSPTVPYSPGWVGYLGYELGETIESFDHSLPRQTTLPDLRLGFYDAIALYDHDQRTWLIVELQFDTPPKNAGRAGQILRHLLTELAPQSPSHSTPDSDLSPTESIYPLSSAPCQSDFTPEQYQQAVQRCVDYIAAGDIFQVNLSQRFTIPNAPASYDIYHCLRKRNPAWYSAYLRFNDLGDDTAIVSSSPELFLRLEGRSVLTRPIKGTRPRTNDPAHDQQASQELLASEKDNAELAMIVDLLRNDLGRVCEFGTVEVTQPRCLETHPTVYHLVATVEGKLQPQIDPAELLRATFPGGSITGAPKIRAMEIIQEIEPVARSVYTGCIGIIGATGRCEWNIAIRTILCDAGTAYLQVGGGIVADSTPKGEYQETLHKARALFEAIELAGHQPK